LQGRARRQFISHTLPFWFAHTPLKKPDETSMKLSDIEIDDVVDALEHDKAEWNSIARSENREKTEAEQVTVCILHALAGVFVAYAMRKLLDAVNPVK
jgi:hypothetical protein